MIEKKDKVFWKWLPAYLKAFCFSPVVTIVSPSFLDCALWKTAKLASEKVDFLSWLWGRVSRFKNFQNFFFYSRSGKPSSKPFIAIAEKNILAEWEIQLPSWSVMDLWFHIALSWPWPEPFEILWIGSFVEVNLEYLLWDRMNSLWYAGVKRSKWPFRIWLISPRAISILQRCKAVRK